MSDALQREWGFYLDDMIRFAEKVITYSECFDPARFITSELNYDATVRNLELIGEAATHVPDFVRSAHPQIPWRLIIATRNRLIHGYLGIDNDTLWSIIQTDIPSLLLQLRQLRAVSSVSYTHLDVYKRQGWWGWMMMPGVIRTSCPAGSSNEWRWRGRWLPGPGCCCWTSRFPAWT